MITKQRLLARLLDLTGLLHWPLRRQQQRLPVLAYHRILDDDVAPASVTDRGLFSATASAFDAQMALVRRYFDVRTFQSLDEPAGQRTALVITFDDGYEDNYRLAFPILRKHGLQAVFFVTTDFIDHGEPLWFDRVAALLASATLPATLQIADARLDTRGLGHQGLVNETLSRLKRLEAPQRNAWIEQLAALPGARDGDAGAPMSWPQLREMSAAGMEIGSHSQSHAVLANESEQVIADELYQSRQRIQAQLGCTCTSLAYPVGGASAINDTVLREARNSGYAYACTYRSGSNALPVAEPLMLVRQHVELDVSLAQFKAQLALPRWFGYRQ